jgi:tetratricopeptide (TPR) repeat protein
MYGWFCYMNKRNIYILITFVITLWLQFGCAGGTTSQTPTVSIDPKEIAAANSDADKLFTQREDLSKLREAISVLAKVRNPDNRDYEVEWKFAKYSYFFGLHTKDEKEADAAFTNGRDAAKIASNMEQQKPDGHFWYGANLGELCKRSPITVGLQSVGDVQDALKRVIEMQPRYQGASAYDGLAQIELGTRLKGGSVEKAVEYLEKAVSIEDDNTNLHLHLAEAYLAQKKGAAAKKHLDILLKMKPNPAFIPEYNASVEAARKLLETKFQ